MRRPAHRVRLGSWGCPSGNRVEVFYRAIGDGFSALELEWDTPPPLQAVDQVFYLGVIRPAVVRLVAEYLEHTGPTAMVDL